MARTATRLYIVTNKITGEFALVEAGTAAGAKNAIVGATYDVRVPSNIEVADAIKGGLAVLKAEVKTKPEPLMPAQTPEGIPEDGGQD